MKNYLLSFLILITSSTALGYNLNLKSLESGDFLSVEEMYVEYKKYEAYRNPYYPPDKSDWTHKAEFHWTVNIGNRLYWKNNFHISMDQTPQVRHGGWEYYLGMKIFSWLDAVKYHHSEHVFEDKFKDKKFPVEDSYGVRVYFKTAKK